MVKGLMLGQLGALRSAHADQVTSSSLEIRSSLLLAPLHTSGVIMNDVSIQHQSLDIVC